MKNHKNVPNANYSPDLKLTFFGKPRMTKLIVIALMLIIDIGLLIKGYEVLIDLDKRIEKNA